MKLVFILNRKSKKRVWLYHFVEEFRKFHLFEQVEVWDTRHVGHAISLAEKAEQEGFNFVIAAGGDGTINEVVNGMAGSETALTMQGEQAPMDVVPLVREATEPLVLQGLRQGRHIELEAPDQPVVALAHPIWLGEVVANLLDNAQRYGGEHIWLRIRPLAGGGAELVVEDDGPGVRPDELPHLFEPFWRGERADLRSDGGTGLGLAIASEIVARLGGTLEAATRPEVDGMRFTVRLAA